jgi:hypothetical protein
MKRVILFVVILAALPIVLWNLPRKGEVIVIDCSLSEISPDFTPEMKQACRDVRRNGL